jgi:glycosyltransferase involved in cell wall biosynthesis
VPLRFGAGVKGKVLEALQHGLPLVTTSVGAEGLPEADAVFNVCDTAEEFAAALVEIERGDADRLQRLSHYRDYLHKYFSKQRAREILARDFGEPCKAEEGSA